MPRLIEELSHRGSHASDQPARSKVLHWAFGTLVDDVSASANLEAMVLRDADVSKACLLDCCK